MYTFYRFQAAETKPADSVDDFNTLNMMATKAKQPPQFNKTVTMHAKASKRMGAKATGRDGNPMAMEQSVPSSLVDRADKLLESDVPKAKPANETIGSVNCCADIIIESDRNDGVASLIPHVKDLQKACLCRSLRHQRKYFSFRAAVLSWAKTAGPRHLLKGTGKEGRFFAFLVNKDYAFRHIFKSGGTTVQLQTHTGKRGHVTEWGFGNRSLFTTVRDPLERFLSGWAECGFRFFDAMANLTISDKYDDRVRAWLQYLRTSKGTSNGHRSLRTCRPHSMPQTNYLWQRDDTFEWHARLDLVGELKELPKLLKLIGFPYDDSIHIGNDARENEVKMRHFPRDTNLLSNNTVLDICRYLALDYYLFDFNPPAPCREMFTENIANMNINFSN